MTGDSPATRGGMLKAALTSYRFLFWFMVAVCAGLTVLLWWANQRVGLVGDPRFFDPHRFASRRDVQYPFLVEVYGYKYKGRTGELIDDDILLYGAFEKHMLFFFRDYLQALQDPEAVFLDVGANTGQHSLFMSRHARHVHAFEPYPPVIARFREMLELNGFTNITLHEVGLGDQEASVPFYAPAEENPATGTFIDRRSQAAMKLAGSFRVVVGDDCLKPFHVSHVAIVKVDVEGYEGPVLRGLKQTLVENRPLLHVEVSRPGTIASLADLKALLPDNYRFLRFGLDRRQAFAGVYELSDIDSIQPMGHSDEVVAYPAEREGIIQAMLGKSNKTEPR